MQAPRSLLLLASLGFCSPLAQAQSSTSFGASTPQSLPVTVGTLPFFSAGTLSVLGSLDYVGPPALLTGTTVINGDLRLRQGSALTIGPGGKLYVYGNTFIEAGALVVQANAQVLLYGEQLGINPQANATTSVSGGGTLAFISPRPAAGQSAGGQQRPGAGDGLGAGGGSQYVDGAGLPLALNVEHRSATSLVLADLNADGQADLRLSGTLTLGLDDAPLVLGSRNLVLDQSTGAGVIQSYSPRRYVQTGSTGRVQVAALAAGSSFVFPVGNAATADYTPLRLTNRHGSATSFSAGVTATAPARAPQPTSGRYWQLAAAEPAAPFDLVLEHSLSTNESGYNDQQATTLRYDGNDWGSPGAMSAGTSPGNLSTAGPVSGSSDLSTTARTAQTTSTYFTKATFVPLPVQLVSFTAQHPAGSLSVLLDWRTASELNNAGFSIERAGDGRTWQAVAYVAGAGTSPQAHSYVAATPYIGAAYYRLHQLDTNGSGTYSPVRYIAAKEAEIPFAIYPNPSGGEVSVAGAAPNLPVLVLNTIGQVVAEFAAGQLTQDFTGKLPAGLYVARQGKKQVRFAIR